MMNTCTATEVMETLPTVSDVDVRNLHSNSVNGLNVASGRDAITDGDVTYPLTANNVSICFMHSLTIY